MAPHPNELELDHAFWNALIASDEFKQRLLQRTRFWARELELVTDEKWHQRWYRDPETRKDSETDILLMWREAGTGDRFAMHIENKPAHRVWEPSQAANYRRRAENRKESWRYRDFEVVLLAPREFVAGHLAESALFDFVLTYEEVGAFVPQFAAAIPAMRDLSATQRLKAELLRWRLTEEHSKAQPWLAAVRLGLFEEIPPDFSWSDSARLAHLINGYDLVSDVGLQRLCNERLDEATQSGVWRGDALELWACLYGEHRRVRHSGHGPDDDQLGLYDQLCRSLRDRLTR